MLNCYLVTLSLFISLISPSGKIFIKQLEAQMLSAVIPSKAIITVLITNTLQISEINGGLEGVRRQAGSKVVFTGPLEDYCSRL